MLLLLLLPTLAVLPRLSLNPFAATACEISGLKDARTRLQTVYLAGPITPTSSAMRFHENPVTCQCEKENKKADGFHIWHLYWSFLSDTAAVKGLSCFALTAISHRNKRQLKDLCTHLLAGKKKCG